MLNPLRRPDIHAGRESALYADGAKAVGMSSLGPGLYFLAEEMKDVSLFENTGDYDIIPTVFNNSGRIVEYD